MKNAGLNGYKKGSDLEPKPEPQKKSTEVIEGKWGNGQERKDRLTAEGYDYNAVQSIVNQRLESAPK